MLAGLGQPFPYVCCLIRSGKQPSAALRGALQQVKLVALGVFQSAYRIKTTQANAISIAIIASSFISRSCVQFVTLTSCANETARARQAG